MRESGIRSKRRRKFRVTTTDSNHGLEIAGNELGPEFSVGAPNANWSADITYVPTKDGWLYFAVVLDLFSRSVEGWIMDDTIPTELTLRALQMALEKKTEFIHHENFETRDEASNEDLRMNRSLLQPQQTSLAAWLHVAGAVRGHEASCLTARPFFEGKIS